MDKQSKVFHLLLSECSCWQRCWSISCQICSSRQDTNKLVPEVSLLIQPIKSNAQVNFMQMPWMDAVQEAALDLHSSSTFPSPRKRRRRSQKAGRKGTGLIKNHHTRTKHTKDTEEEKMKGSSRRTKKLLFRHTIYFQKI